MSQECGYNEPWIGPCTHAKPCPLHQDLKCWSCRKPAVRGCSYSVSLVCGVPCCADHDHFEHHGRTT